MSVLLVAENSHSLKPWLYKFAGAWGNHEGSMLLWVTVLAAAGAVARSGRPPMLDRMDRVSSREKFPMKASLRRGRRSGCCLSLRPSTLRRRSEKCQPQDNPQ